MEQPLDLSITNTKISFTIDYLTSNIPNQKRKPFFYPQQSPLLPLENKPFCLNSKLNEHVVPNISSSSTTVRQIYFNQLNVFLLCYLQTRNALEIVNGGHGIKNPLFDCATEALQIKYGMKNIKLVSLFFFS
jgi:hypothetical protein